MPYKQPGTPPWKDETIKEKAERKGWKQRKLVRKGLMEDPAASEPGFKTTYNIKGESTGMKKVKEKPSDSSGKTKKIKKSKSDIESYYPHSTWDNLTRQQKRALKKGKGKMPGVKIKSREEYIASEETVE